MTAGDLQELVKTYKAIVIEKHDEPIPQDPFGQLFKAVEAVFASWNGKRAIDYRREFKISSKMADGAAVNVQTMVFGNIGSNSATGFAFTRDPETGQKLLFGDYLERAQGEDIVAGIRTPKPISEMKKNMPKMYDDLMNVRKTLEHHFKKSSRYGIYNTREQEFESCVKSIQCSDSRSTTRAYLSRNIRDAG